EKKGERLAAGIGCPGTKRLPGQGGRPDFVSNLWTGRPPRQQTSGGGQVKGTGCQVQAPGEKPAYAGIQPAAAGSAANRRRCNCAARSCASARPGGGK